MLPDAQLLTISTSFTDHNLGSLSSTAKSVLASSFVFVQTSYNLAEGEEEQEPMAHHHRHARGNPRPTENELWFSMPSTSRRQQEHSRASEPSAYQATNHRLSTGSTSSGVSRVVAGIPSISTTADTNKPLPPSPTESERKRRRPTYLRSLLGRSSSRHLDPTRLQPQPYYSNHRYSATSTNLSLDTHGPHHHAYSRSTPSSPYEYDQTTTSSHPMANPRFNSVASNDPDPIQYQPYTPPLQEQATATYFPRQQRSTSMNTYFDTTTPPRALTFPTETSVTSPTMREGVTNRPRPHTWLSPTESFSDASQYSLFVQATTGLPEDSDPFSPNGPPQLQGSLFARRSGSDIIPLPFQNASAAASDDTNWRTDWQNFEPPAVSDRSVSATASNLLQPLPYQSSQQTTQMVAINRELEMLGLDDNNGPDDELPDYAQSQAEAHARTRAEASARAMELEARWRSTRGR
jgi:hypothetical protein